MGWRPWVFVHILAFVLLAPGETEAGVKSEPILSLQLEGRWDNNLVDGGSNGSSLVRPGVGFRLSAPTAEAELRYLPEGLVFWGERSRGGINHRLVGVQEVDFSRRTHLALEERFEQAFDPTGLTRPGVVRSVGQAAYAQINLNASHRMASTWTLGFRGREEVVRIDAPLAVDGAVHAPEGWSSWAVGPRDAVSIWYRFQYFDSLNASDAMSHEPRLGWARALTRHLRLELEGGPGVYRAEGETGIVPVARVALIHRRPRLSIGLNYDRSLFGATGFQGAVWGDMLNGVVNWTASRRWEATAVLGVFQNGAAPDGEAFVRGFGGAAVLAYSLGDDLSAQFVWRRILQSQVGAGEIPALDISRNIVAVGLSWELGRDRRAR